MRVLTIKEMTGPQVHELYKLRVDVFVHEQQCPYAEIDDTDLTARHILAAADGPLLGTARLFPAVTGDNGLHEEVIQFGRFAIAKEARGTGLGQKIMERALEEAATMEPGLPVFLEAQAPLVDYYGQYGFEVCGDEFLDEGIPHVPMIRR